MTESSFFTEITIPQQRHYNGVTFPTILTPNSSTNSEDYNLKQAIKSNKPWLDSLLHQTGAILFRGFSPLKSASHFNDFVEAFGFDEFPYIGGAASRANIVGRVYTANESPPDQCIPYHHEMAQIAEYPSKLFFFCEVEPKSGGETPIVVSHIIYEKMKDKYPDFVRKLEEDGLIYTRVLGEDDNPSSPLGRSWKSTFSTQDKSVAEQRAAKLGTRLEWLDGGGVKTIIGPMDAVKFDGTRQRKIWFNSMVAAYTGWGDPVNAVKAGVTFGDGKPLPPEIVYDCLSILDKESVCIPWENGDVLLLDNLAVLHSRNPCSSPRSVLASLCK